MADGLNEARALRIAEIMTDFRNLQHYIAQIDAQPASEEYWLEGYTLLRGCLEQARDVLESPYSTDAAQAQSESLEKEKQQLQAIILDAAVRRFQCQKLYLRATTALRWINARYALLQGGKPHASHAPHLQAVDQQLQAELAVITDERVDYSLRAQDAAQGKWLGEDPPLSTLRRYLRRMS
ncbi:hypothetical protein P152DRAFT_469224 [Eremomyces bilateralis CBS 781.70]|uniref:Uncharacterized protein n=1 Tax=Eremomyces bilateralis CBS 781.70 TaxID=1392243 RepID=A0A6G1FQF6_9PEZI|nr:uncharacterized protein P152DRAFT_469224 [Eremomyces bilateralis CBS 781.70]KAF1808027.1 hypothetical protein P152DRAFT_469224 [Eremomyces bilateralis CBS 781.70]